MDFSPNPTKAMGKESKRYKPTQIAQERKQHQIKDVNKYLEDGEQMDKWRLDWQSKTDRTGEWHSNKKPANFCPRILERLENWSPQILQKTDVKSLFSRG